MKEIYKGGYIIQPYAFNRLVVNGRSITKAESVVLSAIYSMSANGGRARYSYRMMASKFGIGKSTVARSIASLKSAKLISQDKSKRMAAEYEYVGAEVKKGALRCDTYLFSEVFAYKKKGESDRDVVLTKSEVRLLNKIMSVRELEASERQIAAMLNISVHTVRNGLDVLLHTDLIFRPKKGDCASRKSVFAANRKKLRELEEKYKRDMTDKGYEVVFVPKEVKDANARAERESYYARKEAEKEARKERIMQLLRDNVSYRAAQNDRNLALRSRDFTKMGQIDRFIERLKAKIEAQLPKVERCQACDDSGIRPDGVYCNCWKKKKERRC